MPELPEVEVTRRSLARHIEGAVVQGLRLGAPLRWPLGVEGSRLKGCRVGALLRRGKYLWLPLQGAGGLLLHLGMSGSLAFLADPGPAGKHDHFDLVTDRGTLRLTDPRRFGAVVWAPALDQGMAALLLAGLGAEPFDPALTDEAFHAALQKRRAPIKLVLLSGDIVVGAGNIYACEALFEAGIDPRTPASRLSRPRAARLLQAVRHILQQALDLGGSTLRDFRDAQGVQGEFQLAARVYGREGLPCLSCATPVRRVVMAQRSTYFCPKCQRR